MLNHKKKNFERTKNDGKRPEKSFTGQELYGKETENSKNYSKPKKKDAPKFSCPIGCGDRVAFRNKMNKKERIERVKKYGLCRKCLKSLKKSSTTLSSAWLHVAMTVEEIIIL